MTSELASLLERVSALKGPDREVDARVAAQVAGLPMEFCDFNAGSYHGECSSPGCGKPVGLHDERRSYPRKWEDDERLPRYTSSVDAVLSLIEKQLPGYYWDVGLGILTDGEGPYWAEVYDLNSDAGHYQGDPNEHGGKTPALALLTALLKALSSEDE